LHKQSQETFTTQDHTAESALAIGKKVVQFIPDAQPKKKFDDENHTSLVWTQSAKDKHPESILVCPPDLSKAFPENKEESNDPQLWIKASGSGMNFDVLSQIVTALGNRESVKVVSNQKKFERIGTRRTTEPEYYRSFSHKPNQKVICFPSEQTMFHATLTQSKLKPQIIMFYPRGQHELENAKEMIQMGLSRAMIAPLEYHSLLVKQFEKIGVKHHEYRLICPEKVALTDFIDADEWQFPKNAQALAPTIIKLLA
jgi:RNA-binding protein YhbY